MGGVLIILAVVISTLLWTNLSINYIWLILLVTVGYGLIGFVDDYSKLAGKSSKGIPGKTRLVAEIIIALFVSVILYLKPGFNLQVTVPFFKTILPNLGWGYILLSTFIIVGAANAVNLTDGLDGLAIGPVIICFATYILFAYFAGNVKVSSYLRVVHISGAGELAVFCGALVGAGLGFLWFNSYPAEIFYGRCRFTFSGRSVGNYGDNNQAGNIAGYCRRHICSGNIFSNFSGWLLQNDRRKTHSPDGAPASSFRIERMGGTESNCAFLDYFYFVGVNGDKHIEVTLEE